MNTLDFSSPAAGLHSALNTSRTRIACGGSQPQPGPDLPSSMQNFDDHRDTDSDSEFSDGEEEDIADQCPGQGGRENGGLPTRPTSRLGFNKSSRSYSSRPNCTGRPAPLQTHKSTAEWANGLFQNVPLDEPGLAADGDMDITALASPAPDDRIPARPVSCSSSDASSGVSTDSDIDSSSDCSSCLGDSDEEPDSQLLSIELPSTGFHRLLPPLLPLPIHTPKPKLASPPPPSHDLFPTHTSSPLYPRHSLPPTLPSSSSFSARRTPSLTMPAHHGYSRLAFAHLKWMWAIREEAWRARIRGGRGLRLITDMQALAVPQQHQASASADEKPSGANTDRPVWTMRKEAWMRAVRQDARFSGAHSRTPPLRVLPRLCEMQEDDAQDGGCMSASTSVSTACSDDSDTTLVEGDLDLADRVADFEGEDEDGTFHDIDLGEKADVDGKLGAVRVVDGAWSAVKERRGFYLADDDEEDEDEVGFDI
ncbi:hypothetical protein BD779DRAFT_1683897 [Infundibulicybe gibba]|nr:hypothetical protein BD779DRAFT_1683897 [Infundibulicybe gibba]